MTSTVLCSSSDVPSGIMKDKAVVVMRGNCTFLEKARIAQSLGAKILLIASKSRLVSCIMQFSSVVKVSCLFGPMQCCAGLAERSPKSRGAWAGVGFQHESFTVPTELCCAVLAYISPEELQLSCIFKCSFYLQACF